MLWEECINCLFKLNLNIVLFVLQNIKLSSIKVDTRYTTTQQVVKLIGSHTISKVTVKIGDLKRTKMVRTINLYYNNRTVQAIVELKNKWVLTKRWWTFSLSCGYNSFTLIDWKCTACFRPARWHKAKKVQLTPGQTEVKIDLPLPIVASNLMIEFSDFYENYQASTETLQCPRCSASVPANPGVCGNCGENVYQCHKCRWAAGFFWRFKCKWPHTLELIVF